MCDKLMAPEEHKQHPTPDRQLLLISLLFIIAIMPFFLTPIVPTIDFYNHLARYFVLSHLEIDTFLQHNYASNWSFLPNIGMDILGVAALKTLPPLIAGKLLLIFILFIQYSGVIFLNRQITHRYSAFVALLSIPLLYSYIFFWGFANFLLGLGLTFWAAGWWIRMRSHLTLALPVACVLATVIFLTHGLAFALYGALVGMLEIGLFLERPYRRLSDLIRAVPPLIAQAVVPVLLFRLSSTSSSADGLTNADESVRRLIDGGRLAERVGELFVYRIQTIVRVSESPALWFDALTFTATIIILSVLYYNRSLLISRKMRPALILGGVLIVAVPPAMFGVGYVADRMPLFLALTFLSSLSFQPKGGKLDGICTIFLAIMVAARVGFIGIDWSRYRGEMEQYQTVAQAIPSRTLVSGFDVELGRDDPADGRCAMYTPLLVLLNGQAVPLFAYATQQPLTLIGPLAAAVDGLPESKGQSDAPSYFASYIATAGTQRYFQYLLICNADRLKAPYPPGAKVTAFAGRFTLLKLN